MPFKSSKQRAFMYSQHPGIAKRWTAEAKASGKSPCPTCGGKGTVKMKAGMAGKSIKKCPTCDGEGVMETKKEKGKEES